MAINMEQLSVQVEDGLILRLIIKLKAIVDSSQ